MNADPDQCFVTVYRANIMETLVVPMEEKGVGEFYLRIPIENYLLDGMDGKKEALIPVPASWLVPITGRPYNFQCREPLDLDTYDPAEWLDVKDGATSSASA